MFNLELQETVHAIITITFITWLFLPVRSILNSMIA